MSRISDKVKEARLYAGVTFKKGKLFVPVDCQLPVTAKETIAKQLFQAGVISRDDYEKMLGVVYDGDYTNETEDFGDEAFSTREQFKQSEFAEYEEFAPSQFDEPEPRPTPPQPDTNDAVGISSDKAAVGNGDDTGASQ